MQGSQICLQTWEGGENLLNKFPSMNECLGSSVESLCSSCWHRLNVRSGNCPGTSWLTANWQLLAYQKNTKSDSLCYTSHTDHPPMPMDVSTSWFSWRAIPGGAILRSAYAVAVKTLLDGVTSTNGCCTAAPSFSYSAQTLIVPSFHIPLSLSTYLSFSPLFLPPHGRTGRPSSALQ